LALRLISVLLLVLLAVPVVLHIHPWPRRGADRVRHLVDWPDCARITVDSGRREWPRAEEDTWIDCENLGPWVKYARFASNEDMRHDLLAVSPESAVCIYGDGDTEVAVNGLEAHQFPKLCDKLHGKRVDGVVGLPDFPGGVTGESNERAAERQGARDKRAQHRALAAYFARVNPR
jgi:hypothetical protein